MTTLLFWEKKKKRGQEMSHVKICDCPFYRVEVEAPALTGWFNRRFWNRLFEELSGQGNHRLICGEKEMTLLAEKHGLLPVAHLPILRQLAVPLAERLYQKGMTVTLYAGQTDNLTLQTAIGLCDRFPQVELCVGRETESLQNFLRQKLGASPLAGECGSANRLRVLLEEPENTRKFEGGINLNLTGKKGLFPLEFRDAFLTGPEVQDLPEAYRTDTVCILAENNPEYKKQIRISDFC